MSSPGDVNAPNSYPSGNGLRFLPGVLMLFFCIYYRKIAFIFGHLFWILSFVFNLQSSGKAITIQKEQSASTINCHLINISRGEVVDEEILTQALKEGWIAGAGLDVFEREPLPADSALWDLRNVLVTAHFAGFTLKYGDRVTEIINDNIQRYVNGEPLNNIIDKELCY